METENKQESPCSGHACHCQGEHCSSQTSAEANMSAEADNTSTDTGTTSKPCVICRAIMPIWDWLEDRFGLLTCMDNYSRQQYSRKWVSIKVVPATIAFAVFVQLITGFVLWLSYCAGSQSAWESVYNIQNNITLGWLVRGIHHYSAQVLVALALIYVIKMVVYGAYRYPREIIFWLAMFMFFFALGACLTGDLLRWDQNSLAATQVRTKYLLLLPWIGQPLYELALGGSEFGNLTLSRFLALHIGVCGGGFIALLFVHGWVMYRAAAKGLDGKKCCCCCETATKEVRFWPYQCLTNTFAWCIFTAVVLLLVTHGGKDFTPTAGADLGAPASIDPMDSFEAARPEWSFRGLYEYTLRLQGTPEIVLIYCIPGAAAIFFFLMPFISLNRFGHIVCVLFTLGLLGLAAWLTFASYSRDAKDESYLAAWEQDRTDSARLTELITQRGGISPKGALSMLKSDWVTQGPRIFNSQCVSCHSITDAKGKGLVSETPSAPDLYNYGKREWIAGWLDPAQLKSDRYLGKTAFAKSGSMIKEITQMQEDIDDEEDEEFKAEMINGRKTIIDMLTAESTLTKPRKMIDGKPEGVTDAMVEAFSETFSCSNCHQFYGLFTPKTPAADLTGYTSEFWTVGITSNPSDDSYYGKTNDRMPNYGPDKILTEQEIEMVSKWIRQ